MNERADGTIVTATAKNNSYGMRLPASNRGYVVGVWYLFVLLGVRYQRVSSCILLLNGWEPLSLRALAGLADVVVKARTLVTYKEERTPEARTYTATFRIFSVLKGGTLLDNITIEPDSRRNVYNVSNFGDKTMCYADVTEGETYLLFLTIFGGRLSAKYDDLFGAAADYDDENEAEILAAVGWKPWSSWGSCSRTCDGGRQTRRRRCTHVKPNTCEGTKRQHRKCNTFKCKGVNDILGILTKDLLTPVIRTRKYRNPAILLDHKLHINTATSRVFPRVFPRDFSILVTARARQNSDGYVFTISDLMGFVKLGVRVGIEAGFEYCDTTGTKSRSVVTFPADLADGEWHQFAYSVQGHNVTLYVDCIHHLSKPLERRYHATINVRTVISLGRSFIESKQYPKFEGEIEQLLIIPDAQSASQQCSPHNSVKIARKNNVQDVVGNKVDDMPQAETDEPASQITDGTARGDIIWSSWSSCSVTCGQGTQERTAYCPSDKEGVEWKECPKLRHSQPRSRPCSQGNCPAICPTTCYNGGECVLPARCRCPKGYYGLQCEHVSCNPGCYNDGYCEEPNKCTCLPGYSGHRCSIARCEPACRHGGSCIRPGVCACPYGFLPPDCKPLCSSPCYNGGTCAGFNYCRCLPGYAGNLCQTAVCERGCGNGGVCIAPNTCLCAAGYAGKKCHQPICVPRCQNGGTCLYPFFCLCPAGTYGSLCEKFLCITLCENGGTCIGLDTCACALGYTGRRCEQAICPFGCENGGKCVSPNVCRCKTGYYGPDCERKKCRFSAQPQSYQVSQQESYIATTTIPCGWWGWWRTCTKHKTMYRTVYKTHFRRMCL